VAFSCALIFNIEFFHRRLVSNSAQLLTALRSRLKLSPKEEERRGHFIDCTVGTILAERRGLGILSLAQVELSGKGRNETKTADFDDRFGGVWRFRKQRVVQNLERVPRAKGGLRSGSSSGRCPNI
jgi:hypothetical protein